MKEPVFTGSCTALITPFRGEGIDFEQLKKLLDFQYDHGTAAVVIAGTTGENATLDIHEYEGLVDVSVSHTDHRMKVIVGIGGNDPSVCLKKARMAENAGADAVLMTPPYYNKTTQQGVIRHYSFVADSAELPLILYNVPGRTSIGIAPETYRALSHHPNINGVKEASGDFSLIAYLATECAEGLNLWCGNDDQTLPMMALGAKGVISVASNLIPGTVSELCGLCLAGDYAQARRLFHGYAPLCRLLFCETNPIPVKAAMEMAGLDSGRLRLPLVDMSPGNREMLRACMKKMGLLH